MDMCINISNAALACFTLVIVVAVLAYATLKE